MTLKKIYKLLYYDTERGRYYFIRGNDIREVARQEGYLMAYLIEIIKDKGGDLNG